MAASRSIDWREDLVNQRAFPREAHLDRVPRLAAATRIVVTS